MKSHGCYFALSYMQRVFRVTILTWLLKMRKKCLKVKRRSRGLGIIRRRWKLVHRQLRYKKIPVYPPLLRRLLDLSKANWTNPKWGLHLFMRERGMLKSYCKSNPSNYIMDVLALMFCTILLVPNWTISLSSYDNLLLMSKFVFSV